MMISFRWLGNAGFEFVLGRSILMVDPFLTRPETRSVYFGRTGVDHQAVETHIRACDHILVSHTHFDHFMDVPVIASQTGAIVHGSTNTCALAHQLGVPDGQTHRVSVGEDLSIGDIAIRPITARHPWIPGYTKGKVGKNPQGPLRLRDYRMDTCLSFLITFAGRRLLVWSSTRGDGAEKADVLICRAVSNKAWYADILDAVQPGLIIPSHWDDMFRPLSKPVRPFFAPPRLAFPPIQRIDLAAFAEKIEESRPACAMLVPDRFRRYFV